MNHQSHDPIATANAPLIEAHDFEDASQGSEFILRASNTTDDGFTITITLRNEDIIDQSYLGDFEWKPYRLEEHQLDDDQHLILCERGSYGYITLEWTFQERYDTHLQRGMSESEARSLADKQTREHVEHVKMLFSDEVWHYWAECEITAPDGTELNSDSIGGCVKLPTEDKYHAVDDYLLPHAIATMQIWHKDNPKHMTLATFEELGLTV